MLAALRNAVEEAHFYSANSSNAIIVRGTPEQIEETGKLIQELDQPRKQYRLVYTVTQMDGGKRIGEQTYAVVVASGIETALKVGSRVPIATGSGSGVGNTQFQYIDVGMDIVARLVGDTDGMHLHSKVEESGVVPGNGDSKLNEPVIRSTNLEGVATLTPGKPLVLGTIDVPGSTRSEEIKVLPELVK